MAAFEEAEIIECWEQIEDSGILENLARTRTSEDNEMLCTNRSNNSPLILRSNTNLGNQLATPTVKILKRPERGNKSPNDGQLVNGENKPRQHFKTLQQREQEYAEARLRILGEARSPDDVNASQNIDERISKIQNKMECLKTSESDNVVRLPKGPDGSKGFAPRR